MAADRPSITTIRPSIVGARPFIVGRVRTCAREPDVAVQRREGTRRAQEYPRERRLELLLLRERLCECKYVCKREREREREREALFGRVH